MQLGMVDNKTDYVLDFIKVIAILLHIICLSCSLYFFIIKTSEGNYTLPGPFYYKPSIEIHKR